jgi:hypothetical protein
MRPDTSDLLKRALALPAEARAALAGRLLDSLDETVDEAAEEEWQGETDFVGRSTPADRSHPQWRLNQSTSIRRRSQNLSQH